MDKGFDGIVDQSLLFENFFFQPVVHQPFWQLTDGSCVAHPAGFIAHPASCIKDPGCGQGRWFGDH